MKKKSNYFLLSALFFTIFMFIQFIDELAAPLWFKIFVIILTTTYLVSGIDQNRRSTYVDGDKNDDDS